MKRAKSGLFLADNDQCVHTTLSLLFEDKYPVVASATTYALAMKVVPKLTELGVWAALIDYDVGGYRSSYGPEILAAVQEAHPHIKTIGISVDIPLVGADVPFGVYDIEHVMDNLWEQQ